MEKEEVDRVRELLVETITALCKNGMKYNSGIRVEGLLGVTLDEKDIILINVNKTYQITPSDEEPTDGIYKEKTISESLSLPGKRRRKDNGSNLSKRRKRNRTRSSKDLVSIDSSNDAYSINSFETEHSEPTDDYIDQGRPISETDNRLEEEGEVIEGNNSEQQIKIEINESSEEESENMYSEQPQPSGYETSEVVSVYNIMPAQTEANFNSGDAMTSSQQTYQDGFFLNSTQTPQDSRNIENTLSDAEIFEAAKERIDQLVSKPRGRRGHYRKFDDQTRLAVAKSCLEVGPSETSRRFNISESTVRCMKKVYLRLQAQNPGQEPTSLPCSQRGRPCLIGDFDKKVQDCIRAMKESGCEITTKIVMEAAQGIMTRFAKDQLAAYGGHAKITIRWARSLLIRMGYINPKEAKNEQVISWIRNVKDMIKEDNIPDDLVIHWSEIGLSLTPSTGQVDSIGVSTPDKRQVTVLLSITKSGELLPPQVLYKGKTPQCVPEVEFPPDWDVHYSSDLCSNEYTLQRFIDNIIVKYVDQKRTQIGVPTQPALLLFHRFRRSTTTSQVIQAIEGKNINHYLVPNDPIQQLDLPVVQGLQEALINEYNLWYFYQVEKLTEKRDDGMDDFQTDIVDTSMLRMKPLHASWFIQIYKDMANKADIMQAGFINAKIIEKE